MRKASASVQVLWHVLQIKESNVSDLKIPGVEGWGNILREC